MSAAEFLVEFALEGGGLDGGLVSMKLLPPERNYLIQGEPEEGVCQVWSYRFTCHTNSKGRWILEAERCVGYRGCHSATLPEITPN
jgi:hypothetical protein